MKYKDGIRSTLVIEKLDWKARLLLLIGRKLTIDVRVDTENIVGDVCPAHWNFYVDGVFKPKPQTGQAEVLELENGLKVTMPLMVEGQTHWEVK